MLAPSGDQTGLKLSASPVVIGVSGLAFEPSAFMSQIFVAALIASLPLGARFEGSAILLPSGDHIGSWLLDPAESLVSGVELEPSAFIAQILEALCALAAFEPSRARADW